MCAKGKTMKNQEKSNARTLRNIVPGSFEYS